MTTRNRRNTDPAIEREQIGGTADFGRPLEDWPDRYEDFPPLIYVERRGPLADACYIVVTEANPPFGTSEIRLDRAGFVALRDACETVIRRFDALEADTKGS